MSGGPVFNRGGPVTRPNRPPPAGRAQDTTLADAINAQAAAIREQTELLRQIAGCLFEIAGQEERDKTEGPDRYMDGTPRR